MIWCIVLLAVCAFHSTSLAVGTLEPCDKARTSRGAVQGKSVGSGSFAAVTEICFNIPNEDCTWVEKSELLLADRTLWRPEQKEAQIADGKFKNESAITQKVARIGVAAELKDSYVCEEGGRVYGKTIMRKMTGDLASYLKSNPLFEADVKEIVEQVRKMHKLGVVHQDLYLQNILFKWSNNKAHFFVSDFGTAHEYSESDPNEKSKAVGNFRGEHGGAKLRSEAERYDLESIISSLKQATGIDITLRSPNLEIKPVKLNGTSPVITLEHREIMLKAIGGNPDEPEFNEDNSEIMGGDYMVKVSEYPMDQGGTFVKFSAEQIRPHVIEKLKKQPKKIMLEIE